jgi:hypothetical protein
MVVATSAISGKNPATPRRHHSVICAGASRFSVVRVNMGFFENIRDLLEFLIAQSG